MTLPFGRANWSDANGVGYVRAPSSLALCMATLGDGLMNEVV
jgi:hypothetical protein